MSIKFLKPTSIGHALQFLWSLSNRVLTILLSLKHIWLICFSYSFIKTQHHKLFHFWLWFYLFFPNEIGVLRDIHPWKEILCFYHMVKIHHSDEITCSYIIKRDKQWMPLTSYTCSQKASQILCCQGSSKYPCSGACPEFFTFLYWLPVPRHARV